MISDCLTNSAQQKISCQYFHEEHFTQTFKNSIPKLSLYHHNIRSLPKHRRELQVFLDSLNFEFDILALTEVGQNVENSAAFFAEYEPFIDKTKMKCGGSLLLVNKRIKQISEREDLRMLGSMAADINYKIENVWIEVKIPGIKKDVIIGCIYRHPKGNVNLFTEQLEKNISKIDLEKKICIICGDLNIDLFKQTHIPSENFTNVLLSHNYMPHITLPTRITDTSATLIDHVFLKHDPCLIDDEFFSGNIFNDISDHLPNFLMIGDCSDVIQHERPYVRIYSESNTQNFQSILKHIDWQAELQSKDCSSQYDTFFGKIKEAFEKSFPLKKLSRKRAKDKKWVTSGIKNSSKVKNRLFREYKKKPNDNKWAKYKRYRNTLSIVCRNAESMYFNELIDENKQSLKKMWNAFGPIINPHKYQKKTKKIEKLIVDGKIVTDGASIANSFNDYFVNIGKKLAENIPKTLNFEKYLGMKSSHSMFLTPTTTEEISKELSKLNKNKSSGPDGIPVSIIKTCSNYLSKPLSFLINNSFRSGIFPDSLKIAKVIPIHKKKEKFYPGNYRPISLLSIFSKVFEKTMYKRLYSFLNKYKLLYELQFGFRRGHSTTLALIDITDKIREALDKGSYVLGIYLDLQKAFDTVDHDILCKKLEHYGVRGIANLWFRSYLKDRKQFVSLSGQNSDHKSVSIGVPQGSILGPLLFLLYVNDISNAISDPCIKTFLFADDTNVFVEGTKFEDIKAKSESAITQLASWFVDNRLSLSIEKTHFSIFHKARQKIPKELDKLQFNGQEILRVNSVKYLGILLDDTLLWTEQIQSVLSQMVKYANAFKMLKHIVPYKCKKPLYFAYIYSRIQYGIELYGHATNNRFSKLQKMQNRVLKILYGLDWDTSTNLIHKNLDLLKLNDIFKLQILQFVHRFDNGLLPTVFNPYFTRNIDIHAHETRQLNKFHVNKAKTSHGQRTIKVVGAKLYNNTPDYITSSKTTSKFRSSLKKFLLTFY